MGADVQQVLEQIRETEALITAADRAYRELDARARAEHDRATAAEAELRGQRQSLARRSASFTSRPDCSASTQARPARPLAGVTATAAWPDPARWPDPVRASEDLVALSLVPRSRP